MRNKYSAVLLASLLLLGGCGSKPVNVTSPSQSPVTETFSETGSESFAEETAAESTEATEGTEDTSAAETTVAAAATAGSAPAALGSDTPQPVTQAQTVDPAKIAEPSSGVDDDQMGELKTNDPTTAPAPTNADKPAATAPPATAKPAASASQLATKGGASSGKVQITVPTAEVTAEELKANDYTVDLLITLDKNPGITYSEWGLHLDSRCTYSAESDGLPIETVFFINDSSNFMWTAWASGNTATKKTGGILRLHVKLPRDAKSGSTYPITYADQSLQPAAHIWQDNASNWVTSKDVGWTNGGVVVK